MAAVARAVEILLGLFFIASAASKALDVEAFAKAISAYGVVRDPLLVTAAAYVTLTIETALGACFLARWRLKGATYGGAIAITLVFTGLIFYAWQYKGLEDCGCFGKMITLGPAASIWKNVVLIAVLAATWYGVRAAPLPEPAPRRLAPRIAAAGIGSALVLGLTSYSAMTVEEDAAVANVAPAAEDRPFETFQFENEGKAYNLGKGDYLVAFLSADCPHCRESVQYLNEYPISGTLPELIALMISSSPEEMEDFKLMTSPLFPTQLIDDLVFMEFLRELTHPPRLSYVVDGQELDYWAWEEGDRPPTVEELQEAIAKASPERATAGQ